MDAEVTDGIYRLALPCGRIVRFDEQDADLVLPHAWHSFPGCHKRTRYARTSVNGHYVRMHRLILGVDDPQQLIDHVDLNGLNNTRKNIRLATPRQNHFNRGPVIGRFKGVYQNKAKNRWNARIRINGEKVWLGSFLTEEEAARAYDAMARVYHAEFARLNFPTPQESV